MEFTDFTLQISVCHTARLFTDVLSWPLDHNVCYLLTVFSATLDIVIMLYTFNINFIRCLAILDFNSHLSENYTKFNKEKRLLASSQIDMHNEMYFIFLGFCTSTSGGTQ